MVGILIGSGFVCLFDCFDCTLKRKFTKQLLELIVTLAQWDNSKHAKINSDEVLSEQLLDKIDAELLFSYGKFCSCALCSG